MITNLWRRIRRLTIACAFAVRLLWHWGRVRRSLDRSVGARARQQQFPQLNAGSVYRGCQAIVSQAIKDDRAMELQRQRGRCYRLWLAVQTIKRREVPIRTTVGRKLLWAAIVRSTELILSNPLADPPILQNLLASFPVGQDAQYPCLREAVLGWLEHAGAHQRSATYTSLRNTAKLLLSGNSLGRVKLDRRQQASLQSIRDDLNRQLRLAADKAHANQIVQQYQATYVSLLSVPEAIDHAQRAQ